MIDPVDPIRKDFERINRALLAFPGATIPRALLPKWTATRTWPYHGVAYDSEMRVIEDDDFPTRPDLGILRAWTQGLQRQGKSVFRIVVTGPEL